MAVLDASLKWSSRPMEFGLGLGPWFAAVGYLMLLAAVLVALYRAMQPDPL